MATPHEVRGRITAAMRDRCQLIAPALFVTFVFYILADSILGYATPGFPYVFAWCSACVLGALACAFTLRRIPDRYIHVASASLLWCTTSSTLVTLSATPVPGPILLLTIQIASAGVLLHSGLVIVSLVAIVGVAIPLAIAVPGMPAAMTTSSIVTAALFALLIHRSQLAAAVRAERQLEERANLHEQLLHAQRMEAVGTLAAGVAHDMNNVLTSISNVATLLVDGAVHEQRSDLAQIIEQAGRGAQLTRGLLAFSRRGQYRKTPLGFANHVRQVLPLLRRTLPKSVELRDEVSVGDARVEADAVHLGQVIVNLALNAADAMQGTGSILIRASVAQRAGREHIVLQVADTGHGMDAATRLRVFEPFFTTKPIGQGSGLGLSIVWGIVQAHGGTIEVASEVGVGTTFTVCLPTTELPIAQDTPVDNVPAQVQRNTVLVVDDEALVRESTCRLLSRMGLDVMAASNGIEALSLFDEHRDRIRVVVLDMGMPGMGGGECFQKLRERSDVPVLIATGYAADDKMAELFAAGARIMEKPYAAADLRREVTDLLESPRRFVASA